MSKAASHYSLHKLRLDGEPDAKRKAFTYWLRTVCDVLSTSAKTSKLLDHYPILPSKVDPITNEALGLFLRAKISDHVKTCLTSISHTEGIKILERLQKLYAPATNKDRNKALNNLHQLQMHPKDTITNFVSKFQRNLKTLHEVSMNQPLPDESDLIVMFIDKCLRVVQPGSDVRHTLLNYETTINQHSRDDPNLPFTFAELETVLCGHENTLGGTPSNRNTHRPRAYANATTSTRTFRKPIKCLKCGGSHKLIHCRKASATEKKELWAKHSAKFKKRTPTAPRPQANSASSTTKDPPKSNPSPNPPPSSKPSTLTPPHQANLTEIQSPKPSTQIVHWASMAKCTHSHPISTSPPCPATSQPLSCMSDWLIDSGCSNHMTPFKEDLIRDVCKSQAIIEVANGNLVKAPLQGTARIRIIDVKTNISRDILLDNILYVPGLSRRLFSVTQWTQSGGHLIFNGDLCQLAYTDEHNPKFNFNLSLHAPFSPTNDARHLVRPTAATAKANIPSNLLHRRLGHRSVSALGLASNSKLWADTSITFDDDTFCWGCEITFSKKAKRGKTDLLAKMDLKPGSCLMLDIQKSPSKFSITRSSNYPYYLQITDALTRFTVLLGLTEVSSYAIFDRLLQYSIWFKPNPSFTFDNVSNIHADAGTAFTSKEFISDCEQYGIKVSLAAPRHQEMNGICERTWASIRNIAFSFLVHARVGFEFYSFALEHVWKVHACLPIKNLSKNDNPISPYEYFFGNKPAIRRFRVPFCPCVVNIDQRRDVDTRQTLDRRNHPERGIRGIHVGLPRNSAGWLVYIPSTGKVLVSADVSFDEDFLSSVTYTDTRLPGGIVSQPPSLLPPTDPADLHHTEDPTRFSTTDDAPGIPCSDSHSDTTYIPRFPTSDHNLEPEQKMILDERYNVPIQTPQSPRAWHTRYPRRPSSQFSRLARLHSIHWESSCICRCLLR